VATSFVVTDAGIREIAEAVFAKPTPWVAEAYSEFDALPRLFDSAEDLSSYLRLMVDKPSGQAYVFVVYPDMGGLPQKKTIHLKPGSVPGHKLRYTWQGWGLISIQIGRHNQPNALSRVSANSEKRAMKWAPTYPALEPPSTWNWSSVANHTRRLQRVFRRVA
jgi:hypothetical protein